MHLLTNKKSQRIYHWLDVVGVARFELATLCSQSRCANRAALHPEGFCLKNGCKGKKNIINPNLFKKKFGET